MVFLLFEGLDQSLLKYEYMLNKTFVNGVQITKKAESHVRIHDIMNTILESCCDVIHLREIWEFAALH